MRHFICESEYIQTLIDITIVMVAINKERGIATIINTHSLTLPYINVPTLALKTGMLHM